MHNLTVVYRLSFLLPFLPPSIASLPHKAQEVPASPLLLRDAQDPADLNLSFHGKTPVKSTSKVPTDEHVQLHTTQICV